MNYLNVIDLFYKINDVPVKMLRRVFLVRGKNSAPVYTAVPKFVGAGRKLTSLFN